MHRVNASGELYLTHTVVDGRAALRMAIGATLHRAPARRGGVGTRLSAFCLRDRIMPSWTTLQTCRPSRV